MMCLRVCIMSRVAVTGGGALAACVTAQTSVGSAPPPPLYPASPASDAAPEIIKTVHSKHECTITGIAITGQ